MLNFLSTMGIENPIAACSTGLWGNSGNTPMMKETRKRLEEALSADDAEPG
jgi:hypothetical protein